MDYIKIGKYLKKIGLKNLNKMETKKVEILMEETLRAIKRMENRLEKIEDKINKIENRIINIEIQQNTLISIGKDSKYIKGTTGKMVEQIIFRKYPERTIKTENIEKGSLDEKLLEQYLELEKKRKIREGKQIKEEETEKE